ncbi:CpsD/CapB family tyrosine-protein kinase [Aeromonas schubertii]|uniref:CpsD/CapB family tyrosine-protein kinase n=2 Tax=Aeromonas schubertii TaxID=652 RepID=A0ABS7VA38_9GAMM|nr:CpsD/CapB family tyrosine-protein kinase [Aeromonas schubertii]MBZ6065826.1 CpsD/CapB family tyrosine-protein kinase [Aeromonas schubertii]MBZ6072008.1 CpsD/CapB family tyrosine-protein kinase [Aeromonas schubertii]
MGIPVHYLELERIYAATLSSGIRTLAITSACGGEGTTSLCRALARRAAVDGLRTLLVDFDLHHHGLSEAPLPWTPDAPPSPLLQEERLSLMPAPSQNLLPFRRREAVEGLLGGWLKEYDVVLVDTSPLNAVNHGNLPAEQICAFCEACLMVVLCGVTPAHQVETAVSRLRAREARLLGCVYNDRHTPTLREQLLTALAPWRRWLPLRRLEGWLRRTPLLNMSL